MAEMVLDRLMAGLGVLRPRSIVQLRKAFDDSQRDLRDLTGAVKALTQNIAALETSIQQQSLELAALRVRESQLRAIAQRNVELRHREQELNTILHDPGLQPHIAGAIAGAKLRLHPHPYIVVDDVLPEALYRALIAGLPPVELFADRPANNRQLTVPLHLGPDYSCGVWQFMAETVVNEMMMPALVEKFRKPLTQWVRDSFPLPVADPVAALNLTSSDGRILLRTNGYTIPPHRDPKWGFITCILYLARPGDDSRWGTDLYEVVEDDEAVGAAPHWIENTRCRLVETVRFRKNRALVFLNSTGAHGATIPADAEPPNLERYIYQFRIGPNAESMAALAATLSPERRVLWDGKRSVPAAKAG
jgi:hypothetical protein